MSTLFAVSLTNTASVVGHTAAWTLKRYQPWQGAKNIVLNLVKSPFIFLVLLLQIPLSVLYFTVFTPSACVGLLIDRKKTIKFTTDHAYFTRIAWMTKHYLSSLTGKEREDNPLNTEAFWDLVKQGNHQAIIQQLNAQTPKVINDALCNMYNKEVQTPIMVATIHGHRDLLALFLDTLGDDAINTIEQQECLHHAAQNEHTNILELCFERLGDVKAEEIVSSPDVHTVLDLATDTAFNWIKTHFGDEKFSKILQQSGIPIAGLTARKLNTVGKLLGWPKVENDLVNDSVAFAQILQSAETAAIETILDRLGDQNARTALLNQVKIVKGEMRPVCYTFISRNMTDVDRALLTRIFNILGEDTTKAFLPSLRKHIHNFIAQCDAKTFQLVLNTIATSPEDRKKLLKATSKDEYKDTPIGVAAFYKKTQMLIYMKQTLGPDETKALLLTQNGDGENALHLAFYIPDDPKVDSNLHEKIKQTYQWVLDALGDEAYNALHAKDKQGLSAQQLAEKLNMEINIPQSRTLEPLPSSSLQPPTTMPVPSNADDANAGPRQSGYQVKRKLFTNPYTK